MSLWAVIPMRGFTVGKSRLAGVLDDRARAALNRRLFARTAGCAADVLGRDRVLVVSPDEAVIAAAARLGLPGLQEPPEAGLNVALALARSAALQRGATALFSLSCDLPLLAAEDVAAARDAWPGPGAILLAADDIGTGTNALILPIGADFAYGMGPGSAARHRRAARRAGLDVVEIGPRRPGLRFDLDTPADLARWRSDAEAAA
jgi:2-phospho-L-lactate/phosphoenolpyruvate guanylyltransferase